MASAMLSTTGTLTTNSLANSMLRSVSFFSPPLRRRVDKENDNIGGLTQAMLMELRGATFWTPFSPTVDTSAMGRGTTAPASRWCRSRKSIPAGLIFMGLGLVARYVDPLIVALLQRARAAAWRPALKPNTMAGPSVPPAPPYTMPVGPAIALPAA